MPIDMKHDEGRLGRLKLDWTRGNPPASARRLDFEIQPGFQFTDRVPGDQSLVEDQFVAQSLVARPRPWHEHLTLHMALRDLVGLAAWTAFDLTSISVMRTSDPLTTMDGSEHGVEWRPAQEFSLTPDDRGHGSRPEFLFEYRDLPPSALHRWFLGPPPASDPAHGQPSAHT